MWRRSVRLVRPCISIAIGTAHQGTYNLSIKSTPHQISAKNSEGSSARLNKRTFGCRMNKLQNSETGSQFSKVRCVRRWDCRMDSGTVALVGVTIPGEVSHGRREDG